MLCEVYRILSTM